MSDNEWDSLESTKKQVAQAVSGDKSWPDATMSDAFFNSEFVADVEWNDRAALYEAAAKFKEATGCPWTVDQLVDDYERRV